MNVWARSGAAVAFAWLLLASVTRAGSHPPDGLVVFENNSSASVSVSVDGASLCTIAPGARCTTVLTGDVTASHTVAAQGGSRQWSDNVKISECHANYFGTKTFTFRDDSVPFSCAKQETAAAPSVPPPPAAAKPVPVAAIATKSDLKTCQTGFADRKAQIAACTRVIESENPRLGDLANAHRFRCVARFVNKENVDDALADCTRALTLDPKSFDAYHARAVVNSMSKRLDAALADFAQAIALNPKDSIVRYNRALTYLRKGDLKNAIADLTAERELNSFMTEAGYRRNLCWARVSLNVELDTALSDCESVVRLEPKDSYSYSARGLVRLRKGELKEARADFDKALALDKKNARALYQRALLNAKEGKTMASSADRSAAKAIQASIANDFNDMGLRLVIQAENAPLCPALDALLKAARERVAAAGDLKADVAMPGATYCDAVKGGYWCTWVTAGAEAKAKQAALANASAACLKGYTRSDSNGATGPAATFVQGKTTIVVGTMFDLKASTIEAVGLAATVKK